MILFKKGNIMSVFAVLLFMLILKLLMLKK